MTGLQIARGVSLDSSYITKVAAIVAQRRKGKTYTASVIAEELVRLKHPFVAIDPTGAWWGLRASADGKKAGLSVIILGGQHGDIPIDRHSGQVVADLVVDHPGWYVVDLSLFESHEAERSFVLAFVERLYRRKGQPGQDFALHVIVDEADLYAPEQPMPGDQRMLGALKTLVKRGGIRGIGVTVITQRPASLSKHVLEQLDLLIALRIVGPNDRAAIDRYVKSNAESAVRDTMMGSLSSLKLGEAWLWEPGDEPPLWERVQIRERRTFNSSATPKAGERLVEPATLASVDLDAVKETLAAVVERAERDNPQRLRAEIDELRRELAAALDAADVPPAAEQLQERLVAPLEWLDALSDSEDAAEHCSELLDEVGVQIKRIAAGLRRTLDDVGNLPVHAAAEFGDDTRTPERVRPAAVPPEIAGGVVDRSNYADVVLPRPAKHVGRQQWVDDGNRGAEPARDGDSKLLDVLAWFITIGVEAVDRHTLASFAGVSPKSSSYGKALARLLNDELISYPSGGMVELTEAGGRRARPQSKITTNEQLHDELLRRLPSGQSKIVRALLSGPCIVIKRDELARDAGLSPSSSQYGRDLASLKAYGLIDYPAPGFVEPVVARLWPLR